MEAVSRKIIAIRTRALKALGSEIEDRCPLCMKPAASPYRSPDHKSGCVDAHHTAALQGLNLQTAQWHFRPEAVNIRRSLLASLPR